MFRGQRLGGQSFEPSLEADYGNWAIGVWANDPISNGDKVPGQSDPEIDPYGSYTFNINDSLSIQPGFTWYTYVKAPTDQGYYRMTFEPNIALNYTVEGVKLTPKFYYDVILHTQTYEFDAAYTVPLKSIGSEFDFLGTVGTYFGTDVVNTGGVANAPDTKAWGNYWLAGVSMPFTISSVFKLSVGWAYTDGTDGLYQNWHRAEGDQYGSRRPRGRHREHCRYILTSRQNGRRPACRRRECRRGPGFAAPRAFFVLDSCPAHSRFVET